MDKNMSEDIEESFEIYDPIGSITDSMSIVPIPEPIPRTTIGVNHSTTDRSNISPNSFGHSANGLDTKRIESIDGLPNYDQITEQDFMAQKMSDISGHPLNEERNESLQKLSDNLFRIEDNVKNCTTNLQQILTTNFETYLIKELRDENEKLKAELEKNNLFMKQQLKNLHEWQTKTNEMMVQHKQVVEQSEQLTQENQCLKGENSVLKDKVSELEGMTGLVDQLTVEVQTLQSKCQSMANYEKFDIPSELQNQELNSRVVESQLKIDAMTAEIISLRNELSVTQTKLDSLPAMESQLYLFERDFKIEEMAKLAALKEASELEEQIERFKLRTSQLEESLEKGAPAVELKDDSVGKSSHHRRSRRSGRLGRHGAIPVPSVGAVLKGFKQFKTTSSDV